MTKKRIILYDLEGVMLIVEHPSGVTYQNQVGGNLCAHPELEGVLAPLSLQPDDVTRIESLPYPNGRQGITIEIADTIDAVLAANWGTSFLKVDRARLDECWEAWVHVRFESPPAREHEGFLRPVDALDTDPRKMHGFGPARGVLTWPNSD